MDVDFGVRGLGDIGIDIIEELLALVVLVVFTDSVDWFRCGGEELEEILMELRLSWEVTNIGIHCDSISDISLLHIAPLCEKFDDDTSSSVVTDEQELDSECPVSGDTDE